jgi:hypothetical protein
VNHQAQYQISYEEFKEAVDGLSADAQKRAAGGGRWRSVLGWVLFIGLAAILFMLLNKRSPAPRPPSAQAQDPWKLVLPLIPWLLIFGFIWFFVFRQVRSRHRKAWEQTPGMHRPRTVTIDETGLSFTEPTSQSRVNWDHFVRFAETKNLFLLFDSEVSAELIPKRIFQATAQVDEFRALLARHVSPPTGAFPVLPVKASGAAESENSRGD